MKNENEKDSASEISLRIKEHEWIQSSINDEYNLINARVNSSMVFHGLMIVAVSSLISGFPKVAPMTITFCTILSFTALIIAFITRRGVEAGVAEIDRYKLIREEHFKLFGNSLQIPMMGADRDAHLAGIRPYTVLCNTSVAIWFFATLGLGYIHVFPDTVLKPVT